MMVSPGWLVMPPALFRVASFRSISIILSLFLDLEGEMDGNGDPKFAEKSDKP